MNQPDQVGRLMFSGEELQGITLLSKFPPCLHNWPAGVDEHRFYNID
jgi:hypothetical protein